MRYSYGKEDLKSWLLKNLDTLLERQTFQALIVEVKVADDANNVFVNKAGHDEVGKNVLWTRDNGIDGNVDFRRETSYDAQGNRISRSWDGTLYEGGADGVPDSQRT